MKHIIPSALCAIAVLFVSCTTTTTKNPDGSTVTVKASDPKTIKIIAGAVGAAAAAAATEEIQFQAAAQNAK